MRLIMENKKKQKKTYKKVTKNKAKEIADILFDYYSDAKCGLDFNSNIELVVALILAAQCTDARVNIIRPKLFEKYDDVYKLSKAKLEDIEKIIKPCGFYKNKALNILKTSQKIVNDFDGKVPDNMDDLCSLYGIGRKSANIILQECFSKTVGIAVDTHVTRISRKIGLSNSNTPLKIEQDLLKTFDKKYWTKLNHVLVVHGRNICIARRPKCDICPINKLCNKND